MRPLPDDPVDSIASLACVTHAAEIGDYSSWMMPRKIRLQLF